MWLKNVLSYFLVHPRWVFDDETSMGDRIFSLKSKLWIVIGMITFEVVCKEYFVFEYLLIGYSHKIYEHRLK